MILAKILVEEGSEIEVGSVVAISVEEEGDVAAFKDYVLSGESSAPAS